MYIFFKYRIYICCSVHISPWHEVNLLSGKLIYPQHGTATLTRRNSLQRAELMTVRSLESLWNRRKVKVITSECTKAKHETFFCQIQGDQTLSKCVAHAQADNTSAKDVISSDLPLQCKLMVLISPSFLQGKTWLYDLESIHGYEAINSAKPCTATKTVPSLRFR